MNGKKIFQYKRSDQLIIDKYRNERVLWTSGTLLHDFRSNYSGLEK